jgi:hypothetical protein
VEEIETVRNDIPKARNPIIFRISAVKLSDVKFRQCSRNPKGLEICRRSGTGKSVIDRDPEEVLDSSVL